MDSSTSEPLYTLERVPPDRSTDRSVDLRPQSARGKKRLVKEGGG